MRASDHNVEDVHVQPGECCLMTRPAVFRTVLGSCVGITFLVPRLGIGALCHPMLPRCPASTHGDVERNRYVDSTIREMARNLNSLGATRAETQVKLFGGADVLAVTDGHTGPTVGRLNAEMALRMLKKEGFTVAASSLGGKSGVQIQFRTNTGEVILRRLDGPRRRSDRNRTGSAIPKLDDDID